MDAHKLCLKSSPSFFIPVPSLIEKNIPSFSLVKHFEIGKKIYNVCFLKKDIQAQETVTPHQLQCIVHCILVIALLTKSGVESKQTN